jgi:hypothetical protein
MLEIFVHRIGTNKKQAMMVKMEIAEATWATKLDMIQPGE